MPFDTTTFRQTSRVVHVSPQPPERGGAPQRIIRIEIEITDRRAQPVQPPRGATATYCFITSGPSWRHLRAATRRPPARPSREGRQVARAAGGQARLNMCAARTSRRFLLGERVLQLLLALLLLGLLFGRGHAQSANWQSYELGSTRYYRRLRPNGQTQHCSSYRLGFATHTECW
jgi:hypothetical protein